MQYAVGKTGRSSQLGYSRVKTFTSRSRSIAKKENIKSAAVFITGGFRKADVVVGPKEERPKIVGNFKQFTGPGETLGVGTLYCDDEGPKLHIHAAIGKGDETIVGCPRGGASTFLILEVTIIEIVGINASRKFDNEPA